MIILTQKLKGKEAREFARVRYADRFSPRRFFKQTRTNVLFI